MVACLFASVGVIWLTPQNQVDEVVSRIKDVVLTERNPTSWNLRALPMYAGLATAEQLKVQQPRSGAARRLVTLCV